MRICITGGAGFIGSNLARHLVDRGGRVTVVDDLSTGDLKNLEGVAVDMVEGSILDHQSLATLGAMDAIVHLAAVPSVPRSIEDPLRSHEANATGTVRVLEAARVCGAHVVVASSSSVYGANPEIPKREAMRPIPVSPYAVSKLATEAYALSYQQVYGLPTLAFRFFNVFGPLQAPGHAYAAVVPAFVHAALSGQPLRVHGDGNQTRDFTYVGTVVDTIATALEQRKTSADPVNLAFGTRHSLLELISSLEQVMGRSLEREHVPSRLGDVRDSQADSTNLRELFPDVQPVELEQGLRQTVAWMCASDYAGDGTT